MSKNSQGVLVDVVKISHGEIYVFGRGQVGVARWAVLDWVRVHRPGPARAAKHIFFHFVHGQNYKLF